ncbi:hypothetical protein CONCODRAFT_111823 [Conidiobolus coronatus NRRL 28638]|uniref:Uncharacterized protein n=1 Tax=Conidiobolus coronatus (strain ATCC 28846 / CBS 209.66 / NRRL 28638) TaxID=796925 RepID=A0A137NXX2_CONC2|nr:hypothetical protein CONCODRAFT_111823 [Conidiobolus coronatus NRRL 28638]|eukprot:KXN67730.1 hypothetical protein CONCODRAFT_111823 [Conidiobolus coronatus NRRL 28638]
MCRVYRSSSAITIILLLRYCFTIIYRDLKKLYAELSILNKNWEKQIVFVEFLKL